MQVCLARALHGQVRLYSSGCPWHPRGSVIDTFEAQYHPHIGTGLFTPFKVGL